MGPESHCAPLPAPAGHEQVHAEDRMPTAARHEQVCTEDLGAGLPTVHQHVLEALQDWCMPTVP
jgi:hypothetical protein